MIESYEKSNTGNTTTKIISGRCFFRPYLGFYSKFSMRGSKRGSKRGFSIWAQAWHCTHNWVWGKDKKPLNKQQEEVRCYASALRPSRCRSLQTPEMKLNSESREIARWAMRYQSTDEPQSEYKRRLVALSLVLDLMLWAAHSATP